LAILGLKLAVSFPDTVLEEKESPRDRTAKLGLIARACAIYGVDVVEVFRDPRGHGETAEISKVLEYLETPQYLRRRLFPLDESLRYAGILPPLRIPSHKAMVPFRSIPLGEVREGAVNPDGTVDISPRLKEKVPAGKRVTVRVSSVTPPVAELVPREKVGEYWGYVVEAKSVAEVLSDPRFEVKIATSRLGSPLRDVLGRLRTSVSKSGSVKLIFGSPSKGLFDIIGGDLAQRVDCVVNLFPEQEVETVRTEEAIFAGLGLMGILSAEKA
jgi:methyltransferase